MQPCSRQVSWLHATDTKYCRHSRQRMTLQDQIEVQGPDDTSLSVSLLVNGKTHVVRVDPRMTLLDCLREVLHLTGTKKGCDHGQCGACTVHIDGRRANSCLALAAV